jgi:integrase/recombinase XerC
LIQYLDGRAARFPATAKKHSPTGGLGAWAASAPLFVGADGDRITRGTLQYRVLRAFLRAGIDSDRARGALVHGLRHTFATELANSEVDVYTLMNLLGHESMVTSQRYVTAAGNHTRQAAASNRLYTLLD